MTWSCITGLCIRADTQRPRSVLQGQSASLYQLWNGRLWRPGQWRPRICTEELGLHCWRSADAQRWEEPHLCRGSGRRSSGRAGRLAVLLQTERTRELKRKFEFLKRFRFLLHSSHFRSEFVFFVSEQNVFFVCFDNTSRKFSGFNIFGS